MLDDLSRLVAAAQRREGNAFDRLVQAFQRRVVRYAYAVLGDYHQAEDIAQEAFLEAYRSLPALSEPRAFPGWLRTILVRRCGLATHRKRIQTVPISTDLDQTRFTVSADVLFVRKAIQETVLTAIRELPDSQRLAAYLYYIDDYSQEEIAQILSTTTNTVKKRLQAARSRLRRTAIDVLVLPIEGTNTEACSV
jgi:RNA polymerase sigma factor (sigma-70 family)